jgi:hypothetical protein
MMAVISISRDDIIDVEFETVSNGEKLAPCAAPKSDPSGSTFQTPDQLLLLRAQFSDAQKSTQPDALSPAFLMITLICALVVFWVSGGYALMY